MADGDKIIVPIGHSVDGRSAESRAANPTEREQMQAALVRMRAAKARMQARQAAVAAQQSTLARQGGGPGNRNVAGSQAYAPQPNPVPLPSAAEYQAQRLQGQEFGAQPGIRTIGLGEALGNVGKAYGEVYKTSAGLGTTGTQKLIPGQQDIERRVREKQTQGKPIYQAAMEVFQEGAGLPSTKIPLMKMILDSLPGIPQLGTNLERAGISLPTTQVGVQGAIELAADPLNFPFLAKPLAKLGIKGVKATADAVGHGVGTVAPVLRKPGVVHAAGADFQAVEGVRLRREIERLQWSKEAYQREGKNWPVESEQFLQESRAELAKLEAAKPAAQAPAAEVARGQAEMPGAQVTSFGDVQTGQAFSAPMFRGSGRQERSSVFDPHYAQENIFGDATYLTPNEAFARDFGPQVAKQSVSLRNPLVIQNDSDWRILTREAGLVSYVPINSQEVQRLRQVITSKGYDGVVIRVPVDELTGKRLQQAFGYDTVVDFKMPLTKPVLPGGEAIVPSRQAGAKPGVQPPVAQPGPVTVSKAVPAPSAGPPPAQALAAETPAQLTERWLREHPKPPSPVAKLPVAEAPAKVETFRERLIRERQERQAAGGGAPPAKPPTETGGVPPEMPSEIARSLRQASAMVAQDRPGAISNLVDKTPGVKGLRDWERPGRTMPENILGAHVAETSVRAEIGQQTFATRMPLLQRIDALFGKGAKDGEQMSGIKFLGTPKQAENPITGTFKDMADNPDMYTLNTAQRGLLADMETRNNGLLAKVNQGYGTEIGQFQPKAGGAFLPNVDRSEDAIQAIETFYGQPTGPRAVASGRSKERFYQTARERMAEDKTFVPETDVTQLLRGLDESKASAAAGETFRAGVGGLETQPTGNDAISHSYRFVGDGINRWFLPDQAAIILKLREPARKGGLIPFLANWQATVLGSDFSPLTIQGGQQILFHPLDTSKIIARGEAAFTPDSLAKLVASDPQGWKDFAVATGRSIREPTPGEFGTGWISNIPKAGPAIQRANSRMYNFVQAVSKSHFDADVRLLESRGESHANAIAEAGDFITRMVPSTNATRYGLSPAQAQARRIPLTSVSFVRKSGELLMDASRGYAKIAAGRPSKMTAKEYLAVRRMTQFAVLITTLSVTSAVLEAKRTGTDPVQAVKDALNPASPRFESLVFFGHRVPLGGPLRALAGAVMPRQVSGVPFPIPFGGIGTYLLNRVQPGLRFGLTTYSAVTGFSGYPIFKKGKDTAVMTALKMAAFAGESILPASAGQVAADLRRGQLGTETAIQGIGQVAGQNVNPLYNKSELSRPTRPFTPVPVRPRLPRPRAFPPRRPVPAGSR